MKNVSAIILAAGLSRRMGSVNKLLIPVRGKPMVRHVVTNYISAGIENIIVVVGHQQTRVRKALADLEVLFVFNPHFAKGQFSSIRCGLQTVSTRNRYMIVGLGDQPLLTPDDINYLYTKFIQTLAEAETEKTILVPYFHERRGNPILLTTEQAMAVDSEGVRLGCRRLIEKNPDKVIKLEVSHNRYHCDIDCINDVTQILRQTEAQEVPL